MPRVIPYFRRAYIKVLLLLIMIDLIATLSWHYFFGIEEANPLLSSHIEDSPARFVLIKLGLSLPGIYLLNKYIETKLAQGGLGLLLLCYSIVAVIHVMILFITI